jgi:hypothetical protein
MKEIAIEWLKAAEDDLNAAKHYWQKKT